MRKQKKVNRKTDNGRIEEFRVYNRKKSVKQLTLSSCLLTDNLLKFRISIS